MAESLPAGQNRSALLEMADEWAGWPISKTTLRI
jgi:hypothetical protein